MANDMLSQEEIDALLKGTTEDNLTDLNGEISEVERDALGEIGNISMGSAATALSTLLKQRVSITIPQVSVENINILADEYTIPFVAIDVKYKTGLEGSNVLILKTDDVKIITDLMLGKETFDLNRELTEMDLSAVSEAMNQMMGTACTSLSEMFSRKIDIEPPKSTEITFEKAKDELDVLKNADSIVKISFKMTVGDIINSNIMQLIPVRFAKELVSKLMGQDSQVESEEEVVSANSTDDSSLSYEYEKEDDLDKMFDSKVKKEERKEEKKEKHLHENKNIETDKSVIVKKPKFEAFDVEPKKENLHNESIDLVGDIPVEITAELGRTAKKIKEILEYGVGTIVELDKLVGEPLDVYANGKFIAKGEVVVIDDNFGIRITDISNSYKEDN
ncbi:flagellar motor switch phosphatase FliY [Sporanaerobacter sp. PP17-6a]|jgi:flagellar motor switch protein FliN/FliY|uniref:flagellar motor switch phosphatase FliY n=1 Tax=Sporanaerobacter sp. PP17-6a TaxID=1891289 RepID=UPI0008A07226|nr:flagellar motor switch phosphatase FliY [Sporanaerobacter sp. PP17-6a]SCL83081.1 Flagellar motor switch protein FliN [Sporanaerobacter sp. PP17-6a]